MDEPDDWEPDDDGLSPDDADDVPDAAAADDDEGSDLDDDFPLGDGVADLASVVSCPYCGEAVEITLDPGSGAQQEYIEDCAVCCRPWNVSVTYHDDGTADVFVDASDDQ